MRRLAVALATSLLLTSGANAQSIVSIPGMALSTATAAVTKSWPFNVPNVFVRVSGEGATKNEALDDAFKNAVVKAFGIVVASEAQAKDDVLVKDELYKYSGGFVTSYDVVETRVVNGVYHVEITAKVAGNKIANRLLGKGINESTIGSQVDKIYAQASTSLNERSAGDALLKNLVADYPQESLVVSLENPQFDISQNRETVLVVPASIKWAPNYLEALEDVVKYVSKDTCSAFRRCENTVGFNNGYFSPGRFSSYTMSDTRQADLVLNGFSPQIGIEVTITDVYKQQQTSCIPVDLTVTNSPYWQQLVKNDPIDHTTQFLKNKYETEFIIHINNVEQIRNMQTIEAKIIKSCSRMI